MPPSHRARIVARPLGLAAVATLLAALLTMIGVTPASAADTASISGVVTNTSGEPLPNSSVRVFLPEDSHILKVIAQVYTDEHGAFTFSGLAARDYGVHAYGPSGSEYIGETWDNARSWRTPTVIALAEGEARTGIDLQLALGGVVRGVITDTAGVPVSGAFIRWQRMDPVPHSADQTEWSATTDESGAYEVRRVIPGTYTAMISITDGSYVTLRSDPIVIAGDVITPFDASLTRASVISGTVTDPQGDPAPAINVTLYALQGGMWTEVADSTTSANDASRGRYEFRGLSSGTYTLWFWYTNGQNSPQEWWSDKPDQASSDLIELGTGTSVTADVRLDEGARIQGTLTDEAGVAATGSWAQLSLDWEGAPIYVAKRWVNADGTFEFDRLRGGSYTIEFGGPDFVAEWWDDAPDQQAARRIDVVEGETVSGVDAKLARRASVSMPTVSGSATVGSTLTAAAASPTPDATIAYEWFADGSPLSDASGPSLELRAAQLGKVVTVRVTASAPGYAPMSKESEPTGAVIAGTLTTSPPTIGGLAVTGSTLSANPGAWTSGTSFAYQWFASGVAIDGATGSTLRLASAHADKTITVRVTGTKLGYAAASTTSAPTPKVLFPRFDRDFSGDELPDVLVRTSAGAMLMYTGDGASGWKGASTIGSGWTAMNHVFAGGDFSGDGHEDVMARDGAGRLHLYRGDGKGGWLGWGVVGIGWGHMTAIFSPGDFSGDGKADVMARDGAGDLWLYTGDGKGGWGALSKVGSGWNMFDQVFAAGDFGGYGGANVMGRTSSGDLWVYPSSGSGGWTVPARVGTGWGVFDAVFGSGDFDGDGFDDVMGRDRSGRLWLYPGRGGYEWGSPAVVGIGWGHLGFVS